MKHLRPPRLLAAVLLCAGFGLPLRLSAVLVDFNSTSDLANQFNASTSPVITASATGGLGNTGSLTIPGSANEVLTLKNSFANTGSTFTVSAYMYNVSNSGWGGLGFATASTNQLGATTWASPAIGIGVIFHGGGGAFTSNSGTFDVVWGSGDLALNQWFRFTLTVTVVSANTYNLNILIENSDSSGTITGTRSNQSVSSVTNTSIGSATDLFPYLMHDGSRFTVADNFTATGPAAIPEPAVGGVLLGFAALGLMVLRNRKARFGKTSP